MVWFVVFEASVCLYRKVPKNFGGLVLEKGIRVVFVPLGDFAHQLVFFLQGAEVDVFTNVFVSL